MASRRFTVDPVKKKEFINIFLLMPETRIDDAMRKAEFTKEDIADLPLRRFLQRALPGGSIKGLRDYIAHQRKQPPPHLLPVDPAATDAAATVPPPEEIVIDAEATTVLSSLSPGTATKRKKDQRCPTGSSPPGCVGPPIMVERNDYATYTMDDVPPLPDYKVILPKGKFNGLRAHYNIRTDSDLGIDYAALRRVACGCELCKEQLGRPWVLPCVDVAAQPRYGQNKECTLWPSYEGGNDWKICRLVPKTEADKKGARESHHSVLGAMEAHMSLMIREGEVGAIGTADEATMGYYVVKWLSEPYTLQEETEGMSGMIGVGTMVADMLYFNQVERARHWYTQSNMTTVVEVRYVLLTGFQLQPISETNKLPTACNRKEAAQKKAVKVTLLDHEVIMEEAGKRDRLEYDDDDSDESEEESEEKSEEERGGERGLERVGQW